MKIYPAIDLMGGKVVRLFQGRFDALTEYSSDPLSIAQAFRAEGAAHLHVVDLEGARVGRVQQAPLISAIAQATELEIQIGGGIRETAQATAYLNAGASRVVIGSLAAKDPKKARELMQSVGMNQVTLAVDFHRDVQGTAFVACQGWQETTELKATEFMARYAELGISRMLCTDVDRDGTLQGPDTELYQKWQSLFPEVEIQVSGGVGSLSDLVSLKQSGARAVIIGKALYEGTLQLKEALAC